MRPCRTAGVMLVLLFMVSALQAQTIELQETNKPGDCLRLQLQMELKGEMRVYRGGRQVSMPLQANAEHDFCERTLNVGTDGLPDKTCRSYANAKSLIFQGARNERMLRPERSLIVAQRYRDRLTVYSPAGPLTREELELSGEHLDTLALSGLLPGKAVSTGATWKVPNAVVQALCGFEGLTEQSIECKLEEVNDQSARIHIVGEGTGIDLGALVKLKLEGTIQFDLKRKRISSLELKQHDERDQGPASPASTLDTVTRVRRGAIDVPDTLSDSAIVSVPEGFEPLPYFLDLTFQDLKGRFHFAAAREWQTVSKSDQHIVLRLLEAGEFIAQATITPWTRAETGQHLAPEAFRKAMEGSPGWQVEEELQAGEIPTEGGRWVFRLATQGTLDGSKVMQNFYLIASPEGDQVVVAVTFAPKNAERLATRDLAIATSIEFEKKK
jgi:hypothetical protein